MDSSESSPAHILAHLRILVAGLALSCCIFAQPTAKFEVASIKPSSKPAVNAGGEKGRGTPATGIFDVDHLTFTAQSINLHALIVEAWGLRFCRPFADTCPMLAGEPPWLTTARFDVRAKAPAGSTEYTTIQLRNAAAPQLQEMLRALLIDRFHLKVHTEQRQLPVYAFTVAGSGLRLRKAEDGKPSSVIFKPLNGPNGPAGTQVIGANATIQDLADLYSKFMNRPVIDSTSLNGRYDFTIEYEADPDAGGPFSTVTSTALFKAFESQGGLLLKAVQAPLDVLVVESATRPTTN